MNPVQFQPGPSSRATPWESPGARGVRVFCFPYAGGAAVAYRGWMGAGLDRGLVISPVELPGHGTRMRERPIHDFGALVDTLFLELEPLFRAGPFALFGHSMGGLIAAALARRLSQNGGAQPQHLFLSGAVPPPATRTAPRRATDEELKAHLRALGGTPEEVLQNVPLMDIVLPVLRADMAVVDGADLCLLGPLATPVTSFAGLADPAAPCHRVEQWRALCHAGMRQIELPGDHFFLNTASEAMLELIAARLRDTHPIAENSRRI